MASTGDFRNGMMVKIDGDICKIVDFQHVKPGKGGAFVRTKLKRVVSGAVIDRTFRAGEKVEEVRVERHKMQYTYRDGSHFHLMNLETYEEVVMDEAAIGDDAKYLKEGTELDLMMSDDGPLGMELPTFVVLEVTETDPGFRGDTASGGGKPATMETGLVVQVPLFIEVGERLKIDTRSGEYVERVNP
ncbi:MAG: elongation factor P [Candidatus Eisenbacteria bacterium]|uniref:Elongation factor P n=1 Tax=Eiseniibacteriota bacterium TaxID=2212470 RepID=A0A948RU58_UNCEI|nr:elongation factor P [Candidatus Eisenbacteria bacterium]MBU1951207.1 elongation factor P [Candidatus Eisenbacteria bacterium]MBU2690606.1 elongation factor P [Candidatus Eisenbacteria bacterium]